MVFIRDSTQKPPDADAFNAFDARRTFMEPVRRAQDTILPVYEANESPLVSEPSALGFDLLHIAPMGLTILDDGVTTLPAFPIKGKTKTNGWDQELGTSGLRTTAFRLLWEAGKFNGTTRLFIPSGIPHGITADHQTAETTDWAGAMIQYFESFSIPHLRILEYHNSVDTISEAVGLALKLTETRMRSFPAQERFKYHTIGYISEASLHFARQDMFFNIALLGNGEPGPWLLNHIDISMSYFRENPTLAYFAIPEHIGRIREYIHHSRLPPEKISKVIGTLQFVHDMAKDPDKYLHELSINQLQTNAKQTIASIAAKRKMDRTRPITQEVIDKLERNAPEIRLIGVEHVFRENVIWKKYLESLQSRNDIRLNAMSALSGWMDAAMGWYYHPRREILRAEFMRTGINAVHGV